MIERERGLPPRHDLEGGVSCDEMGLFVGEIPLLEIGAGGLWRPRPTPSILAANWYSATIYPSRSKAKSVVWRRSPERLMSTTSRELRLRLCIFAFPIRQPWRNRHEVTETYSTWCGGCVQATCSRPIGTRPSIRDGRPESGQRWWAVRSGRNTSDRRIRVEASNGVAFAHQAGKCPRIVTRRRRRAGSWGRRRPRRSVRRHRGGGDLSRRASPYLKFVHIKIGPRPPQPLVLVARRAG